MAALDILSSVLSVRRAEKMRDAETPEDAARMLRSALMRAVQLQSTGNKRMQVNALREIKQLRADMVAGQVNAGNMTGEMVGVYGHVIDQIERMQSDTQATNGNVNKQLDALARSLPSADTLIGALMTANPLLGYGVKIIRDINRSRKESKLARLEKQKAEAELVDTTTKEIMKTFSAIEEQQKATADVIDSSTGVQAAVEDLATEQKSFNTEERKERKKRQSVYKPMLEEIKAELQLLRMNMGMVEAEIAIAEARPDHVVIDNVESIKPEPVQTVDNSNVVPFVRPDQTESAAGAVKEETDPVKQLAEKQVEQQRAQIKRLERIEDEDRKTNSQLIKLDAEAANDDDVFVKAIDGLKGTIRKVAKENIKHIDKLERKRGRLTKVGAPASGPAKTKHLKGNGISDKSEDNSATKTIFGAILGAFTFLSSLGSLFMASGIGKALLFMLKPITSLFGFIFKFGAVAARFAGKFLGVAAIIGSIFAFFDGFFNTEEIFKKATSELSIGDRIIGGLSNMAASLFSWFTNTMSQISEWLGFGSFEVDKDEIARKIYEWVQGIPDMVLQLFEQATSAIKAIMNDITSWFQKKIDGITEEVKKYVPDFMMPDETVDPAAPAYVDTPTVKASPLGLDGADYKPIYDPWSTTSPEVEKYALSKPSLVKMSPANQPSLYQSDSDISLNPERPSLAHLQLMSSQPDAANGPATVAAQAIKEAGLNAVHNTTSNNVSAPSMVNAPVSNVTNNSNSTTVTNTNTSNSDPKFRRTADRGYK